MRARLIVRRMRPPAEPPPFPSPSSPPLPDINTGDVPDYGQRKNRIIGERVDALLRLLETRGGPNALPNIRYLVPTHAKLV